MAKISRLIKKTTCVFLSVIFFAAPAFASPVASVPDAQNQASVPSGNSRGKAIPLITIFGSSQGPGFDERAEPEYPFAAKKRGQEGTVVLQLTIDELGILQEVEVVEATDPVFVDAAVASVKRSFFVPAKNNNRRVASKALLPIHFKLKK
ncbi:MAG: TonB family protein [Pseudomonadota bacterium]